VTGNPLPRRSKLWEVTVNAPVFSSACLMDVRNSTLALGAHDGQLHVLTLDRHDRSCVVHRAVPLGTSSSVLFATPFAVRSAGLPGCVAATIDGKLWHCAPTTNSDDWRATVIGYDISIGLLQEFSSCSN